MFKFLKHTGPKTKILFVAFILVLVPGAVISYLSLQSVRQKADNLRITYNGTVNLVRDKLENEVERLQSNLLNSVIEQPPGSVEADSLEEWISERESENPAFRHLFLSNNERGIITSSLSLAWNDIPGTRPSVNPDAATFFNMAENAEFISKDYPEAIKLYREALASASSSRERALILSRVGRCYIKQRDYRKAIQEYEKIIAPGNNEITIGNVPAQVVALSQIADSYEALGAYEEQYNATIELYELLLDRPWDLANGEYLYYLSSAGEKISKSGVSTNDETPGENNIRDLLTREEKLLEEIRFIRLIDRDILPEIESGIRQGSSSELQSHSISRELNDSIIKLSYFKLPATFQDQQLQVLAYQFDNDYILSNMFPNILASVELGKDVLVGILGTKDSLLYIQNNIPVSEYLVAGDFTGQLSGWKVALFDPGGRSIEQITGKEKLLYLILFAVIIAVMLIGIILMVRTVVHESEISRLKSEFVSNVSHELKTPLALIRMFGETLDSGMVKDDADRRKFYSIIRKESERLTHLINNVLDFSRMDAGVKEYNFRKEDLVETVRSSLETYKYQINDSGFSIESELPGEPVMLKIDRDAISQVLLNLLNNAVKYSDEEKYILVKVWKDSDSAMFSVTDHGMGIKREEIKKIFDKFYRVSTAETGETRGSGLGLTLAQHIVEAHGGRIDVESEVGKGSTFTVSIPLGGN
ncbi:MAG: GHKL domain-containing protein [Bacteroidales bacterium]|nr:GHKL domain-containing protein [Bacteroidales bacterium]